MSLFIKGVFMPKAGELRTFNLQNGIIEILSPHGRLIDADALRKKIESIYGGALWTFDCFECIREAPTIIEAEVSE